MATVGMTRRVTGSLECKKDIRPSCITVNIRMVENEDLFEISDTQDVYQNQKYRMERFRNLCCRLIPSPPSASAPVEWHHLVDLFCAFTDILGREGINKDCMRSINVSNQRHYGSYSRCSPEVSVWFKEGPFPAHTKIILNHDQPWQAQVYFDTLSNSHEAGNTVQSKNSERIMRARFNEMRFLEGRFIGSDNLVQTFSKGSSNQTANERFRENHKYSPVLIDHGNRYIMPSDHNDQAIYVSSSAGIEFTPNSSPNLSTASFNSLLTSFCDRNTPDSPSQMEDTTQKMNSHQFNDVPITQKNEKDYTKVSPFNDQLTQNCNSNEFYACRSVLGFKRQLTVHQALLATASGLDLLKYKGDITASRIRDQLLQESENCSLRLTEINPETTDKQLFDTIDTGKVYFYQRLPSRPGIHRTCAANLAFFERNSAEKYYLKCSRWPGIWLNGYRIKALWNRDKSGPPLNTYISRVITVYGPASFLFGNEQFISRKGLEAFFHGKFHYTLVTSDEWMIDLVTKAVRLEFGSARCQGQFAKMSLSRLIRQNEWQDILRVEYEADPCDRKNPLDENYI